MDRGFAAVVEALGSTDTATVGDVFKVIAKTLMSKVGGAAGPLYGTAFMRAAKVAPGDTLDAAQVADVIEAALRGIVDRGQATVGDKTMVDAGTPALAAAREAATSGDPLAVLTAAAAAAEGGAAGTVPLVAHKGRASYLGERSAGHEDPGARSTAIVLAAAVAAAREV